MPVNFSIGNDDFAKLITKNCTYIDKTLWIKEIISDDTEVLLFTRPRRFGKTINMSTLRYFLDNRADYSALFNNLKITQHPDIMAHQGKYPVIFITLKNIKKETYDSAIKTLALLLQDLFASYKVIYSSLSPEQQTLFNRLLHAKASDEELANSLLFLSQILEQTYGHKVWILIDEYDRPLHQAWEKNFYEEMKSFMQGFLGAALKTNTALYKGLLTGVLRVSKEGLFSDLNNIKVHSMLSDKYGGYFGFTDAEVDWICDEAGLSDQREQVRAWYNGYQVGPIAVYNPWSIINFAMDRKLGPYWNLTGNSQMIGELVARGPGSLKSDFEILLKGGTVQKLLDERISFAEVEKDVEIAVWSFLTFAGYLKVTHIDFSRAGTLCTVAIPNQEILGVYETYFMRWLSQDHPDRALFMLKSLTQGDIPEFQKIFNQYLKHTLSYFDTCGNEPERFYHGLVLGMLVYLHNTHEINSNRESGYGRYDVMIIPKDLSQLGLIIEFKTSESEAEMPADLDIALKQIEQKNYQAELERRGIKQILKLAIVFFGKKVILKACSNV